ncbi:MAG: glycosyltransferase family 2 protein [Nitrososphaerota archaeon]
MSGLEDTSESIKGNYKVVACIPAYNEERTIAKVILKAQKHVDVVLVCDDGSADMTAEIAGRMGATVLRHENNKGKGAALRTLFDAALKMDADIVVTLDADGQHDPDDIPVLIEPIKQNMADIVIGSRFLSSTKDVPLYRRFGNKILNFLTSTASKKRLTDTQSGFRAYSFGAIKSITIIEDGIGVDSQIIMDALKKNLRIVERGISVHYEKGTSTYNPVTHMSNVIVSIINYAIRKRPLTLVGVPGFLISIAGFGLIVYVIQRFFEVKELAVGTMFIGALIFMIGIFMMLTAIMLYAITGITTSRQ